MSKTFLLEGEHTATGGGKYAGRVVECFSAEDCNEHLDDGWNLLAVVPNTMKNSKAGVIYILGATFLR